MECGWISLSDFAAKCLISLTFSGLQDVMFRESRRPKGDPEVLAAQSREQYFKVLTFHKLCSSVVSWLSSQELSIFSCEFSFFLSWKTDCNCSHWESVAWELFQPIYLILQKLQLGTSSYYIFVFVHETFSGFQHQITQHQGYNPLELNCFQIKLLIIS